MTTGWLLLLLVVCSQSVDSQSTTDDETRALLSNLHRDIEGMLRRMVMNRVGESQHISPTRNALSRPT